MKMGVLYQWDAEVLPLDAARYAEALGFESIWMGEHSHIPVRRETPFPGGGELPEGYKTIPDPFSCLGSVSVGTSLRLGMAVLLMPMRDPISTAKEVATLDAISGGRVEVGVGVGWLVEQMRNHGVQDFERDKYRLMRERVEAMKEIWTNDEAEYHGKLVDFDPIWCRPKPVQQPHPPVLIAGWGPTVLDKVLAYGDGWIPNFRMDTPENLVQRTVDLRRRAREERGLETMPVTVVSCPHDAEVLRLYAEGGIDRVVVNMRVTPNDQTDLDRLDRFAELVHEASEAIGAPVAPGAA